MVLKSLELHGFKSFPDKTVLNFGSGITAVVGPNGSGKSNISDAIRWVLGEQSSKSLRGSRMEDVIFSGTPQRKAVGYAEVSLVFDNSGRILDFDADDVKVTRRYYRSGESEYLINNATVRLRDVQMMFMDTGLGRDGYSIIGQGRIGDIVSSKSEERREIFEEAAGIAKYRHRKNEAERRLNATEDNLLRLRDILQEMADRVGPLAAQSEKAKKFLEYAGEKKELEIGLWLHTIEKSRETLRDLDAKLELARTQYDTAGNAIEEIEQQTETLAEQARQIEMEIELIRQGGQLLEEDAARAESEAAVFDNDIFHNNENITRIEGEIAQSDQSGEQLKEEIGKREQEIEAKQVKIVQAEQEQLTLAEQLSGLSHHSDAYSDQMEELSASAAELALQLSDIRVQAVTGESSLDEITRRITQLSETVVTRREQSETAKKELDACKQDLSACEEQVESLRNTVNGYEIRYQSRAKKLEEAKQKADQLFLDAEDKKRRIRTLEEMERNMEGFSGSVRSVVKQAERGALRGIHGPVSRFLKSEAAYALAIETALGAAAQNIICDKDDDAKRAIAHLKETNGGRVTLLPLNVIRGRKLEEKSLMELPGVVGIASDLVTYDAEYREIVLHLLGNIVVAEDLDYAVSVARKFQYRFRIVTLDGQVVNAKGSLTGGSSVKNAGLLSRRTEIERLQKDAADFVGKVEAANEEFRRLKEEVAKVEAELLGSRGELATLSEDKIRVEGEIRRLTELFENSETACKEAVDEMARLNARAEECRRMIAEAQKAHAEITAKKEAVEEKLEETTGGRQQLAEQREALSAQMAEIKLSIVADNKEIEALRLSIEELELRGKDAEGYRVSLREQIEALNAKNEEIANQAEVCRQKARELRAKAAEQQGDIEALLARRTAGEAEQTALRQQTRDRTNERELAGRDIARMEEKYAAAEKEAEDVVNRLYAEYELTRAEAEEVAKPLEDIPAAKSRLSELKNKIRALGNVNVDAIEEYKEVSERYEFLSKQVEDVEVSKKELLKLIDELTVQMREMFIVRFRQINENFGEVFTELFGGGKAELKLSDMDNILESGIEMSVQPPKKLIRNLESLSGGEKALTAIALLFAILKVTPSPFCVLDEIEAALDDVNVERYARYIHRMEEKTQFICITHRRGTMEEADVLYGVTMRDGISQLLSLQASEVEARLGMKMSKA